MKNEIKKKKRGEHGSSYLRNPIRVLFPNCRGITDLIRINRIQSSDTERIVYIFAIR